MINLLLASLMGFLTFSLLHFTHLLKVGEALVPAFIVTIIGFFVLGYKTAKKLEILFNQAGKDLQNQKFDAAINTLQTGYLLAKRQLGIKSQIDSQIGMIYYLRKDFSTAIPYLESSKRLGHWMGVAMLAVAYFKKKDYKKMKERFELLVKRAKKQGLAWNLYAYCLIDMGQKENAQKVLSRGELKAKDDSRVKENLLALQNGKKIKMKNYQEWYQFHLEAPPPQMADRRSMYSGRSSRSRRYFN